MNEIGALQSWQKSPLKFVTQVIGATPTTQQRNALEELGFLVLSKMKASQGIKMTEREKEYAKKMGISIVSGHGAGKDAWISWGVIWFLMCFPNPKIPCTAPTSHQLDSILWSEISKWIRNSSKDEDGTPFLTRYLTCQNKKIFFNEFGGKEWFAIARTINPKSSPDEQAETIAGFHEDFMMIVVDEASGVPDPVFRPLEGGLTGKCNFIVLIFNPTKNTGFAMESQTKYRKNWVCLHWDSEDSEIVNKADVQRLAEKYGRDSNFFRIRVKGLPPKAEPDVLIPWEWIQLAIDREIETADDDPLIFGVDVGAGGDHSTILKRTGPKVHPLSRYTTADTMVLTGYIAVELNKYPEYRACCIDNVGIGLGVYNRLRELEHRKVFSVDARATARDETRFFKLRDELYWKLRELFESNAISIPDDPDLIGQLSILKTHPPSSDGRTKVLSKDEMRKQGIESPNDADALMLSMKPNDSAYRRPVVDPYEDEFLMQRKTTGDRYSWMAL